jgi:alpha-tubulin suppressor-like RCC1 family protein
MTLLNNQLLTKRKWVCLQVLSLNRTRIVSVSAGANHTLAISETGELWSCGRGREGQLGLGTFEDQTTLCRIRGLQ